MVKSYQRVIRGPTLLTIALLLALTGCNLLESPPDCRNDVIQKVPIYPDAQLVHVDTDNTSNNLNWGSFTRHYETSDSVAHVLTYYGNLVGCTKTPPQECGGFADGDNRIYYVVKIAGSENGATFSVFFSWMCSRGQFSNP
jgi:hypothetical protein